MHPPVDKLSSILNRTVVG